MITLAKLKELSDAATPAPWKCLWEILPNNAPSKSGWLLRVSWLSPQEDFGNTLEKNDIEFIAASREAVPLLIEEVERLRETLESISHQEAYNPTYGYSTEAIMAQKTLAQSKERLP